MCSFLCNTSSLKFGLITKRSCAGNLDPISMKPLAIDHVLQPITNTGSPRALPDRQKLSSGRHLTYALLVLAQSLHSPAAGRAGRIAYDDPEVIRGSQYLDCRSRFINCFKCPLIHGQRIHLEALLLKHSRAVTMPMIAWSREAATQSA